MGGITSDQWHPQSSGPQFFDLSFLKKNFLIKKAIAIPKVIKAIIS